MTTALGKILLVKELGYDIVYRNKMFDIDPRPDDEALINLVKELKDDLLNAHALMKAINTWGGDDIKKWSSLLNMMKDNAEDVYAITPRRVLLDWCDRKVSLLYKDNIWVDIAVNTRAIAKWEELVPQAFIRDKDIADMFRLKIGMTIKI